MKINQVKVVVTAAIVRASVPVANLVSQAAAKTILNSLWQIHCEALLTR